MSDKLIGNLHIFVNSVDFIASVIKKSNLSPEQVKVVCSNNSNPGRGIKPNQKKLGEDYKIEKALDSIKRINFYTSTCFEGCDIYDPLGKTYIVSDRNKRHTQLDISTLLIQICGRIRNTKYKKITHIFSYTRYNSDISIEEFEKMVLNDYDKSKKLITEVNLLTEESRLRVIKGFSENYCNENYITVIDDKLHLDKNLLNIDIVNFKIATGIYSNRIAYIEELRKNGIEHRCNKYDYYKSADAILKNKKTKLPFKEVFEDYIQLQANKSGISPLNKELNLINEERPLVAKAFFNLGVDKVRELNHNVSRIKAELIKISDSPHAEKIKKLLLKEIGMGKIIEDKIIKEKVQKIYRLLNIIKKPKATVLNEYFDV